MERERQLRADPYVVVLSPEEVRCKLCSNSIKLSKKSAYDSYHWMTHRKRCLDKQKKTGGNTAKGALKRPLEEERPTVAKRRKVRILSFFLFSRLLTFVLLSG